MCCSRSIPLPWRFFWFDPPPSTPLEIPVLVETHSPSEFPTTLTLGWVWIFSVDIQYGWTKQQYNNDLWCQAVEFTKVKEAHHCSYSGIPTSSFWLLIWMDLFYPVTFLTQAKIQLTLVTKFILAFTISLIKINHNSQVYFLKERFHILKGQF